LSRVLPSIVIAALIGGCASAAPSPSPESEPASGALTAPSAEESPTLSPVTATATVASSPPASAIVVTQWQSARITVDGLAVRAGPGSSYPLIDGYALDAARTAEVLVTDEVRVNEGHYVYVDAGPLNVAGVPWYRVINIDQPGDEPEDTLRWDADGDDSRFDAGWVAGGDATTSFLVPDEPPPTNGPSHGHGPDPLLLLAGTGNATSEPFFTDVPVGISWHAADPDGDACDISITLEPASIDMGSQHIERFASGDDWWPREGSPTEGDYRIEVQSSCSWSLRVSIIQG
jgi:hypothetical protein